MKIMLLLSILFLSGCAATDVSQSDRVKGIIGQCYQLTETGELMDKPGSDKESVMQFTLSYLFLSSKTHRHAQQWAGDGKLIQQLPVGTKLKIAKVIDYPYGSAGRCWVVKAKLLGVDTKGKLVEIPSCVVWDQPIWVSPATPYQLASEPAKELRIHTPVLAPTGCP